PTTIRPRRIARIARGRRPWALARRSIAEAYRTAVAPRALPEGTDRCTSAQDRGPDRYARLSKAWRRDAEEHAGLAGAVIHVPVRDARGVRDGISFAQHVVLVADPQVEHAFEDHHDLLVRIVGVRIRAGATARLDRRQDQLESAGHVRGEEFVDRFQPGIRDPTARLAPNDPPRIGVLGEELGDRQVKGPGDALDGRDRRAGHVALDLGEEALRHPGADGDVAQRQMARLAQ